MLRTLKRLCPRLSTASLHLSLTLSKVHPDSVSWILPSKGNNRRREFSPKLGKLFSLFLREAIMSAIQYAREESGVYELPVQQRYSEKASIPRAATGQRQTPRRVMRSWLVAISRLHAVRIVLETVSMRMEMSENMSLSQSALTQSEN